MPTPEERDLGEAVREVFGSVFSDNGLVSTRLAYLSKHLKITTESFQDAKTTRETVSLVGDCLKVLSELRNLVGSDFTRLKEALDDYEKQNPPNAVRV